MFFWQSYSYDPVWFRHKTHSVRSKMRSCFFCFCLQKRGWKSSPWVSLKISRRFTLTNVETRSWTVVTGFGSLLVCNSISARFASRCGRQVINTNVNVISHVLQKCQNGRYHQLPAVYSGDGAAAVVWHLTASTTESNMKYYDFIAAVIRFPPIQTFYLWFKLSCFLLLWYEHGFISFDVQII